MKQKIIIEADLMERLDDALIDEYESDLASALIDAEVLKAGQFKISVSVSHEGDVVLESSGGTYDNF